jgi:hypothetical protein
MAAEPQDDVRRRIASERDELMRAVTDLRAGMRRTADLSAQARAHLLPLAAAAAGAGFLAAGGLGGTIKLLAVRRRVRRERSDRSLLDRFKP